MSDSDDFELFGCDSDNDEIIDWDDYDSVLKEVTNRRQLKNVSQNLLNNFEIVMKSVQSYGMSLQYVSRDFAK
jgi:hypothetical protein